jgi:DNA-binding NarL/FixJ family response regulator
LAQDHASFRKSLRLLVEMSGDIRVLGELKDGHEAVRLTARLHPDVVVMEIAMPLFNGLQATQQTIRIAPLTKVLILSLHSDPEYVREAMTLGASGYLIKQSSTQLLAEAIRAVFEVPTYFSASIPKKLRAKTWLQDTESIPGAVV